MNVRHWLGLVLLLAAILLVPIGMYFGRIYWLVVIAGVCMGVWLLRPERDLRPGQSSKKNNGRSAVRLSDQVGDIYFPGFRSQKDSGSIDNDAGNHDSHE